MGSISLEIVSSKYRPNSPVNLSKELIPETKGLATDFSNLDLSNESEHRFLNSLQDWLRTFKSKGFDIGGFFKSSIHDPKSIRFYKEVLKADQFCIDLLEQGFKLPFKDHLLPTEPYFEPNNKSTVGHEQWLWNEIKNWEKLGKVS